MKSLFRDFRFFMARSGIITIAKLTLTMFAVIIALGTVRLFAPVSQSVREFIDGFLNSMMFAMPACCIGMSFGITNYLSPMNPGYKLFHFVPDGGKRFRNALIFANLIALVVTLISAAVLGGYFALAQSTAGIMTAPLAIGFGLISLGILNFLGFTGSVIMRLVMFMCIGGMAGFLVGFSEDVELTAAAYIVAAAGVGLWLSSMVFVALVAEKRWYREK